MESNHKSGRRSFTQQHDAIVSGAINRLSEGLNRRSFLLRMGERICMLGGISFVAASVVGTGMKIANAQFKAPNSAALTEAPAPCTHENKCDGSGTSLWDGFQGSGCEHYGVGTTCGNCLKADGCPEGTTMGTNGKWSVCIKCKEDATKGTMVDYWDCCGTIDAAKCPAACTSGPAACGNKANCVMNVWCGTPARGGYVCTVAKDTGTAC